MLTKMTDADWMTVLRVFETVHSRFFLDGPRLALHPHTDGIMFTVPAPEPLSKVHR
jgi:hypothetical protein